MSVVQCHPAGIAGSMFHAGYNHRSKYIRSELMNTPIWGILWQSRKKSPQPPLVGSIFWASAEHPFASVVPQGQRASKLQTAIIRIKKYRLMTLNDRHIKNSSFTPSPTHTALKKAAKVIGIVVGAVVGIILWAILKPIYRGIGGVISLISAVVIIFWLITNF